MRLIEVKEINNEQLDESHPMTRMMLKAMGSRDPEEDIANSKKSKKAYQSSSRAAGARKRPLVRKKMSEARVPGRIPPDADDDYGDWAYEQRKDKELDQRWERETERGHARPQAQRFEDAIEDVIEFIDDPADPEFKDFIDRASKEHRVDAYSLANAVENILKKGRGDI